MLSIKKPRIIILVTLLLVSLLIGTQVTYASVVGASAPNIRQAKSNWCWAASSASLLQGKGRSVSQQSFSITVKGNSTNNSTATTNEVVTGLTKSGYTARKTNAMSISTLRSHLSNRRAVIGGYLYRTGGGGHMVVISGHDSEVNNIEVMDPAVGRKVYYNDSYFRSNNSWYWHESVY